MILYNDKTLPWSPTERGTTANIGERTVARAVWNRYVRHDLRSVFNEAIC